MGEGHRPGGLSKAVKVPGGNWASVVKGLAGSLA